MNAWQELLREFGGSYDRTGNAAGHGDDTGSRGLRAYDKLHRPLSRQKGWPYDGKDNSYGQPAAYDRGSGGREPIHEPLTPVHMKNSGWEDADPGENEREVDEAMGCPSNAIMAYKTGQQPTGIPGAGEGWASMPARDWDDDEEMSLLDLYGEGYQSWSKMTWDGDDKIPSLQQIMPKDDDRDIVDEPEVAGGMFPVGSNQQFMLGKGSPRTSRGLNGLIPKESAWDNLDHIDFEDSAWDAETACPSILIVGEPV